MKRRHFITYGIVLVCLLLISPFVYSFFYPGESGVIDTMRLSVQSKIMATSGDIILGEPYRENGMVVEGPHIISYADIMLYVPVLEPGDILFAESERFLSSEFIPGKWKHNFIYLGTASQIQEFFGENSSYLDHINEPDDVLIIDSSSYGVSIRPLKELSHLDSISFLTSLAAVRLGVPEKDLHLFVDFAISQEGKKYDYDLLTDDSEDLYCSELIYESLKVLGIHLDVTDPYAGRYIITPNNVATYMVQSGVPSSEFSFLFHLEKVNNVLVTRNWDYFVQTTTSS